MKREKGEVVSLFKGYNGCLLVFGILICLFFISPFVLGGLFWLALQEYYDVEWHSGAYYLQQTIDMGERSGNSLFYKVDDEKLEILPHVYGYEKQGFFIYLASAQGYGIVDLRDGTADIVLQSKHIPRFDVEKITYSDDLRFLSQEEQKKVLSLPHTINAYFIESSWRDGETFTVADGRFQYDYARVGEMKYHYFQAYGLYGDFDRESRIFSDLTGYHVDNHVQIMYVTSPQGYAIVDGPSGTCRIYFTDPELAAKEYQKDIHVLDSFEEFTPEEQEILRKVEQDGL